MICQSFVINYYRMAIAELNQYCHYCGIINEFNYCFEPDPKYIKEAHYNNDVLPEYEFTDETPVEMIEKYLDYYGEIYPNNKLFMTPVSLKGLYDYIEENFITEDKQIDYVQIIIGTFMVDMVERGVFI